MSYGRELLADYRYEQTHHFEEDKHMANIKATQVVTNPVRLSYVHLFTPYAKDGQEPKYSACLLIPKTDTATIKAIKAACEAARLASGGLFDGKVPDKLKLPIHDGDGEMPTSGDEYGPECKGMYVINASSKQKPGIVNRQNIEILDSSEVFSGCWARVDLNFYAYSKKGNKGIACGLNNLQKYKDDEALGGRARAQDVFDVMEDDGDDLGL